MGAFADGTILGMPRRLSLLAGTGLASLFAAGLTFAPRPARALPEGGQVVAGQAQIGAPVATPGGRSMTITQGSTRAVIDWRGFSIAGNEHLHVQQPGASSVTLHRVTGADPSAIAGRWTANGQQVLINPNGIVFSRGAQVDTAGLVASTLDVTNGEFMGSTGRLSLSGPGRAGASVANEGEITVRDGGLAALVAPEVRNSGVIRAQLGRVVLAGAESVVLDPRGDGLISFEVARSGPARQTRAENTGRIEANGGSVTISAASARGIVAGVVNIEGQVVANSVGERNGVISFGSGPAGETTVAAQVEARGTAVAERGGRVTVTGERVRVAATARIDASGRAGGGQVLVGGNLQGRGPEQNARETRIEQGATIRADATARGNGGSVIVWSDEFTRFMGGISATGGALGGDGGFAEVSGKRVLEFRGGTVDLSAPLGAAGNLLLDPTNITIAAAPATTTGLDGVPGAGADRTIRATDAAAGGATAPTTSTLLTTDLQAMLASANVTVTTASDGAGTGVITVQDAITWTSGRTLTLTADASIAVNAAITASTGNGNLALNAQSGISIAAPISLGTGTLSMTSVGDAAISQGAGAGAAISAGLVSATLSAGANAAKQVALANAANAIGAFTIVNPDNATQLASSTGFQVRGLTSTQATLTAAAGDITQATGAANAIAATTLSATASAGSVVLGNAANAIGTVSGSALGAGATFGVVNGANLSSGTIGTGAAGRIDLRTGPGFTLTVGGALDTGGGTGVFVADTLAVAGAGAFAGTLPERVEFRTATAGRAIFAGDGATGPATALVLPTATVLTPLAPATTGTLRIGATGEVAGEAGSGIVTITGITVGDGASTGRLVLESASADAGGAIRHTAGIVTNTLEAISTGRVRLDEFDNSLRDGTGFGGTVIGRSGAGGFAFQANEAFRVGGISAPGQTVRLVASSFDMTQLPTGAGIVAATLDARTGAAVTGDITLDGAGNQIGTAGGAMAGAGGGLYVLVTEGPVTLSGINVGTRIVSVRTTSGVLTVGSSVTAGDLRVDGAGGVAQTAPIAVANVRARAPGGAVLLTDAANSFTAIEGGSGVGIGGTGTGAFRVATAGALSVGAAGEADGIRGGGLVELRPGAGLTVAEPLRAGAGGLLDVRLPAGQTLAVNAGLVAPGGALFVTDLLSGTGGFAADADRPATSVIRTATAGRSIGVGAGAAGLLQITAAQLAALSGTDGVRVGSTGAGGEAASGQLRVGTLDLSGRTLALESGAAGTAISDVGNVTAAGLSGRATSGAVDFSAGTHAVGTIAGQASGDFTFRGANAVEVRGIAATGAVALETASGSISQAAGAAGGISGASLGAVAQDGSVLLGTGTNSVASVEGSALGNGRSFVFGDSNALAADAITLGSGGTVELRAGPGTTLTVNGPITNATAGATFVADTLSVPLLNPYVGGRPQSVTLRTATAGRPIVAGFNALFDPLAGSALVLDQNPFFNPLLTRLAPAAGGTLRIGSDGTGGEAGSGQVRIASGGLSAAGQTVELRSAAGGTAIDQAGAITADRLRIATSGGDTVLENAGNAVGQLGASLGGALRYRQIAGLVVTGIDAAGQAVNLRTEGNLTQAAGAAAAIVAGSLAARSDFGGVTLDNAANAVGTLSGSADSAFAYRGTGDLALGTLGAGSTLNLRTTGGIAQGAGTVAAGSLVVTAGGNVAIEGLGNAIDAVTASVTAPGADFRLRTAGDLVVAGITAPGTVVLTSQSGSIGQAAGAANAIEAASVTARATNGSVLLQNAANTAIAIAGAADTGFAYTGAGALSVAGINAGAVTLNALGGGIGQTGTITAGSVAATATGAVVLDGIGNDAAFVSGNGNGGFAWRDANGFTVGSGITVLGGTVTLRSDAGSIAQLGAIFANAVVATANAGNVTLGNVGNTLAQAGGGAQGQFLLANFGALELSGINAGSIDVAAGGTVSQSGALSTTGLARVVSINNSVVLDDPLNDAASVAGSSVGGFTWRDATGFDVAGISAPGNAVTLRALGGGITQSAAITGASLLAEATGAVALGGFANAVGAVSGNGAGFAVQAAGPLSTGAIASTGTVLLSSGGTLSIDGALSAAGQLVSLSGSAITQSAAITAGALGANAAGSVALTNAGNEATGIAGSAGGSFAYTDATGLVVAGIAAAAGVTLDAGGPITQTAAITALALSASAGAGGAVTLTRADNDVASVAGGTAGAFAFRDANGFDVAGITAGSTALTAGAGDVTQSAAIVTGALSVNGGGAVTLAAAGNQATSLAGSAAGAFRFEAGTGFAVAGLSAAGIDLLASTGSITQTGAVTTGALVARATGGDVALTNAGNDAASIAGSAGGSFAFTDANALVVAGISAGSTTLTALGGAITQTAAITTGALSATASTTVTLDRADNDATGIAGGAGGQFTYRDATGFDVAGIGAGGVSLFAGGDIGQTGAITTGALLVDTTGAVALANVGNDAGSIAGSAGGSFAFTDATALVVAGINAGSVTLQTLGGAITQTAAITTGALSATASTDVTLDRADNSATGIAGGAGGQFTYRDAGGIDVAGFAAAAVSLTAGGSITQSVALTTGALVVNAAGDVTMTNPGNDAASIAGSAGGSFAFTDATGLVVAGIGAASTTLQALGGAITQTAAITTGALSATASTSLTLDRADNQAASIAGGAGGAFTFRDVTGFDVAGIAAGDTSLVAGGAVTQSGAITAGALTVNAAGPVTLTDAANDAASIGGSANGAFAYRDASALAVQAITATGGDISLRSGGTTASAMTLAGDLATPGFTVRLQSAGDITQQAGAEIAAARLLAIAGGRTALDAAGANRVGTVAGRAADITFRNAETLIVGAIDGDAAVGDGAAFRGLVATGTTPTDGVRIIVADPAAPGAVRDLTVQEVVGGQRIQLTIATGAGLLRVGPNTLVGAGGAGNARVALVDTTGSSQDVNLLEPFGARAGTPPNVPVAITLGNNSGGRIDLTTQTMSGTALYVLINGALATNTGGALAIGGLAAYPGPLASTEMRFRDVTLGGQGGQAAASQSSIAVNADNRFTVNECPIGTVACLVVPLSLPNLPRLGDDLLVQAAPPRLDDSTLSFINLGAEDSDERDEERRVPVGRPAPRQE